MGLTFQSCSSADYGKTKFKKKFQDVIFYFREFTLQDIPDGIWSQFIGRKACSVNSPQNLYLCDC